MMPDGLGSGPALELTVPGQSWRIGSRSLRSKLAELIIQDVSSTISLTFLTLSACVRACVC